MTYVLHDHVGGAGQAAFAGRNLNLSFSTGPIEEQLHIQGFFHSSGGHELCLIVLKSFVSVSPQAARRTSGSFTVARHFSHFLMWLAQRAI